MSRMKPARPSAAKTVPADPPTLEPVWRAEMNDNVPRVVWSPDGVRVAAVAADGSCAVLDSELGAVARALAGHDGGATDVDWSSDGLALMTAGEDGTVRVWDPTTGAEAFALEAGGAWVERCGFSADGGLLAASTGKRLRVWDRTGEIAFDNDEHPSTITDLAWEPGRGRGLAVCHYNGITVWDPDTETQRHRMEWTGSALAMAWSPDGKHLATGDQDATVHFWILSTADDLRMSGYPTKVKELAWDRTGRHLATGGSTEVTIWDCSPPGPAGTRPQVLEGDETLITCLAYHPSAPLLAAGTEGGRVLVWRAVNGAEPAGVDVGGEVASLVWSPEGDRLAVGAVDGGVGVIDVQTPAPPATKARKSR